MKRSIVVALAVLTLTTLLPGCRKLVPGLAQKPPLVVSHCESSDKVWAFSDREEISSSKTTFDLSRVEGISGQGIRIDFDIEGYGGFAIPMSETDLREYDTLSFWIRKEKQSMPPAQLQFKTAEGARKKMTLNAFLQDTGSHWQIVEVPLTPLMQFSPEVLRNVVELAVIFKAGDGALEFDEFRLERTGRPEIMTSLKPDYPEKSEFPLPNGHGAWCYDDPAFSVKTVITYNEQAPDDQKIRYLFPWAGSLSFTRNGGYDLTWDPKKARFLAEALEGEVHVLPMIDGLSAYADIVSPERWTEIADEIARLVDAEPLFYGIHLDIEPHEDVLYRLFAEIKKNTPKPLTVAVGAWTPDIFGYTDMVVLMGYDWAYNPTEFERLADMHITRFLREAKGMDGKAMIGFPAIATHREYESTASEEDGPRKPSGFSMIDFVRPSLRIVGRNLNDSYIGVGVWALHPQDGLHGSRDTLWYYPTTISDEIWDMLRAGPKKWKRLD